MRPPNTSLLIAALSPLLLLMAGPSSAAAEDACFIAAQTMAQDAERICSDRIAGLRYDGTAASAPALAGALNNRAMARLRSGDLEGAAADFGEALTMLPDAWAIYLNRGNLFLVNEDPGAALNDYGRVAELSPADSPPARAARRNSVLAWRALGNLAAAEKALDSSNPPTGSGPPPVSRVQPSPAEPVSPPR